MDLQGWMTALLGLAGALVAALAWAAWRRWRRAERQLQAAQEECERLAAELRSQRLQSLRLQRQQGRLLSGIAHSLRQPLWALRLYNDTLLRHEQAPQRLDLLQRQGAAVDDTGRLLDQLSHLAAIRRGLLPVREEAVDLRELLAVVAGEQRMQLQRPGMTFRVHARPLGLRTDRAHLLALLRALAGYAAQQAAAARGERARVLLGLRRCAGGWAVELRDNGAGLAAERLAEVFEPYAPLDGGESAGRQGVSLAIAQGLAEMLGLALEVCSAPERGTRFRLALPPRLLLLAERPPLPVAAL